MADSDVVLPNTGNPLVDTSQITTGVGVVQRQRVALGDTTNPYALAAVTPAGELNIKELTLNDLMLRLLLEVQFQNIQNFGATATDNLIRE
jgi:hypothetical protein